MTEEVKIKVASNILTDVGKVMTAHSYSVKLPRTTNNDSIFAMAYVVCADTGGSTTHCYLPASFYVDDIPLFEGGKAVLNKVDDKGYNINLFWGLLGAFDEIKREDLDLCDLPMSEYWAEGTMATWVQLHQFNGQLGEEMLVPTYRSGMDAQRYASLDEDSKALADRKPWTCPYIGGGTLLDKIATVYDITFDKSALFQTRLSSLYFPLTTLKAMADGESISGTLTAGTYGTTQKLMVWVSATSTNGHIFDGVLRYGASPKDIDPGGSWPGTYYVPVGGRVTFSSFRVHGVASKPWRLIIHPEWRDACEGATPVMMNSENWRIDAVLNDYQSYELDVTFRDVTAEDWNLPYPDNSQNPWGSGDTPEVILTADYVITESSDDILDILTYYPIERNLPNIKVLDFIGEVLAHCGAFVVGSVTKPNAIKIITFDEVAAATPVDITSYGVESITMAQDGLAQRNEMTHKSNDDDGLEYLADGYFTVQDNTLEVVKTYYQSKFKVPRNNLILQFETSLNDDSTYTAKWVKAGDYVCGLEGVRLYNTGQDFDTILTDYYGSFRSMMSRPKIIEVAVRMGILDLLNFDFTKPLYIPQLASTFAIVELNSDGGDKYKLKLIKL